jgi:hypothetical protein
MPSHFSSIGLPLTSQEDFLELADRLAGECEEIAVKKGRYLRWSSPCGAEAWLQVNGRGGLIGMNPHFSGNSTIRVGLTARISRPDDSPFDGAFHGWADPPEDNLENGVYPFVFDAPDFLRYADAAIPGVAQAQIAAFAHEITVHDSVEEYDASQTGEAKFASQSFIPSGLFSPEGETTEPPQAYAILSGHVRRAEKRTNGLSGDSFYWAEVESYGGVFDVVIDPELLEKTPVAGGVVSGAFWLSGRLSTYTRSGGGAWRRLFGR